MPKSLSGYFLIASPHLPDPNFFHSVVLMIHHDAQSAFGVVLNRPTMKTVRQVWEMVGEEPCDSEQPINLGGPVEGPLLALHTQKACSETEILPGLHLATSKEHLNKIVQRRDRPYRIFSGYAGWGEGQLDEELKMGGWLTTPATREDVFSAPDEMWELVTHRVGREILAPTLKFRHAPSDPSLN